MFVFELLTESPLDVIKREMVNIQQIIDEIYKISPLIKNYNFLYQLLISFSDAMEMLIQHCQQISDWLNTMPLGMFFKLLGIFTEQQTNDIVLEKQTLIINQVHRLNIFLMEQIQQLNDLIAEQIQQLNVSRFGLEAHFQQVNPNTMDGPSNSKQQNENIRSQMIELKAAEEDIKQVQNIIWLENAKLRFETFKQDQESLLSEIEKIENVSYFINAVMRYYDFEKMFNRIEKSGYKILTKENVIVDFGETSKKYNEHIEKYENKLAEIHQHITLIQNCDKDLKRIKNTTLFPKRMSQERIRVAELWWEYYEKKTSSFFEYRSETSKSIKKVMKQVEKSNLEDKIKNELIELLKTNLQKIRDLDIRYLRSVKYKKVSRKYNKVFENIKDENEYKCIVEKNLIDFEKKIEEIEKNLKEIVLSYKI
ncbi:MAG: hypothetical protein LBJ32_02380 [Oscillospiraceae bacterium]|jgi:hypothetical protein|nr:hypothetical protein [Oscillospiraceae bacterium]